MSAEAPPRLGLPPRPAQHQRNTFICTVQSFIARFECTAQATFAKRGTMVFVGLGRGRPSRAWLFFFFFVFSFLAGQKPLASFSRDGCTPVHRHARTQGCAERLPAPVRWALRSQEELKSLPRARGARPCGAEAGWGGWAPLRSPGLRLRSWPRKARGSQRASRGSSEIQDFRCRSRVDL